MNKGYNWDEVPETNKSGFELMEDGEYLAQVVEVDSSRKTRGGDEMWRLKFRIVDEGEYFGRLVWDNWVFSTGGLKRIKYIRKNIGLNVTGIVSPTVDEILGKVMLVSIISEEYNGKTQNKIPFDGYLVMEDLGMIKYATDVEKDYFDSKKDVDNFNPDNTSDDVDFEDAPF